MSRQPITVVIPTRNRVHYLREALDSLLAQSSGDWCAVVVDDGSDTPAQAQLPEYAGHPIAWLRNDRSGGVSAARNLGAQVAGDGWIVFLDDDDWLHEDFIAQLRRVLDEHGERADVVFPQRIDCCQETGRRRHVRTQSIEIVAGRGSEASFSGLLDTLCTGAAFKRAIFIAIGGFDPTLAVSEDRDLLFRMLENGAGCMSAPAPIFHFRIHAGSRLSRSTRGEVQTRCDLAVLERHRDLLRAHPRLCGRFVGRASQRLWRAERREDAIRSLRFLLGVRPLDPRALRRLLVWSLVAKLHRAR